jgi:hypothetical protein
MLCHRSSGRWSPTPSSKASTPNQTAVPFAISWRQNLWKAAKQPQFVEQVFSLKWSEEEEKVSGASESGMISTY